jgi:hypothetical protein
LLFVVGAWTGRPAPTRRARSRRVGCSLAFFLFSGASHWLTGCGCYAGCLAAGGGGVRPRPRRPR